LIEYDVYERIDRICSVIRESTVNYQVTQEKDKSLKSLFEVKRQFVQLIKTFVKESWTEKLTEDNIELADKEFIMSNMHETRADLIYRVKDEDIYFILLEFQSTEDGKMPYRLLSYILEIWRRYENNDKLPVVIPCVLYTGNTEWKIKTLRSLFDVSEEIEKYIPDFEYILIDVNRYTDEELMETANLVSSVIYMAKSKDKNEVADKLRNIISLVGKLDEKEQDAFIKCAEGMFYRYNSVVYDYFEENFKKEEEKDMALIDLIPGAIEIFRDEGRTEGFARGKDEGRDEGRLIEKRSMLVNILTKKLGSEPNRKLLMLIGNSSKDSLDKIEEKIFEIMSWKEVEEMIK